ncbi:uncharacterized protein LOC113339970 [Papaver somniferum]|uniref:uncharacterized protein LOC113339970 n=1 Tax=Papaver somniferum TaxID=3469 RepID=UPI000E7010D2|nr:uncharacterized protein LOC113339970 [Papaver somniferum]
MARTNLIFSFAFAGFIMLSISHMALGVSQLTQVVPKAEPLVLKAPGATLEKNGKDQSDLQNGKFNRGGTEGLTAANGLARANDGGVLVADLNKGKVTHGPEYEHVKIADGAVSDDRISQVDTNNGQVTTSEKAKVNFPGVANVNTGTSIGVNIKNEKVYKDNVPAEKSNGNYK